LALQEVHGTTKTIVQVAQDTPDLKTLVTALTKSSDLVAALSATTAKFTIFAPSNAAFTALPKGVLDNLLKPEMKYSLEALLKYHAIASTKMASALTDKLKITTLQTQSVTVTKSGGKTMINNDATVTTADVAAANGVIHIINKVLMPNNIVQVAQATATLSSLVTAVVAADLVETLSGGLFTVFAPTNAAFKALPDGKLDKLLMPANKAELVSVLKYHVQKGVFKAKALVNDFTITTLQTGAYQVKRDASTVMIGKTVANAGATLPKVTTADVEAFNGIVHIVDKVLIPPATAAAVTTVASKKANNTNTTVGTLSSTASTTGIATAVVVALGLCAIQ